MSPLGRDASASGSRSVRIWGVRRSPLGREAIASGARRSCARGEVRMSAGRRSLTSPDIVSSDYFVIKGKGRNPFGGFLPLCYWCVVIVCTI